MPAVFTYVSTRMILAALTTLLLTIYLGPPFIKKLYELKIGQAISRVADCPVLGDLHEKKKDTPTMGGVLILTSVLVALLLWMDLTSLNTHVLLITTVWLGILGGFDDYLKLKHKRTQGLSSRTKIIWQLIFAALFGAFFLTQYREFAYFIPFYKHPLFVMGGIGAFCITLFVVIGASNAVNLTDGLDGLASLCMVNASLVLAIFAFLSNHREVASYLHIPYLPGASEVAIFLSAVFGACMGFLWYNGYPAQVFMGDTGSLALGGILGVAAVLLRREGLLALVGGVFVVEALSVILQVGSFKLRNRKRIFLCAPLHHHFEYKGWPETKVTLRFWIFSFLLAILGLASIKFQ